MLFWIDQNPPRTLYLAITSIYPLAFFPFLRVPPCLACGAPIKSSILLALLTAVPGRDGAAEGGPMPRPTVGPVGSPCNIAGDALLDTRFDEDGLSTSPGAAPDGAVILIGGVAVLCPRGSGGTGGVSVSFLIGGPPLALTALDGGPLGGGGVADALVDVSPPPFLLTHFFKSLS